MNFQERNKEISGQVFQGCGRPLLGRRRRDVNDEVVNDDFLFMDGESPPADETGETHSRHTRNAEPEHNKEIRDFEPVRFSSEHYGNSGQNEGTNGSGNGRSSIRRGNRGRGMSKSRMDYEVNMEPTLDKLIKDIRQRVRETKKLWSNLPLQMCLNEEYSLGSQQKCWNGKTAVR